MNLAYVLEDQERKDAEKLGESDKSREANGSTSKHAYDNNSIELEESGERKKEMEADDPPDYEVVIGAPKTSVEVQADFPMNEEDTDLKLWLSEAVQDESWKKILIKTRQLNGVSTLEMCYVLWVDDDGGDDNNCLKVDSERIETEPMKHRLSIFTLVL